MAAEKDAADRIALVVALTDLAKSLGWKPRSAESSDLRVTVTFDLENPPTSDTTS
jgi:hypothetical protein